MSWSINLIGKPENIKKALEKESAKLSDKSKQEFDAAMPHLIGLVEQNYNNNEQYPPILQLTASGHGYDKHNQCSVKLESLGGQLV